MANTMPDSRYRVITADGDLALVQSLLNSAALPHPRRSSTDLLDEAATANQWLDSVGANRHDDIGQLRALRETLKRALILRDDPDATSTDVPAQPITATLDVSLTVEGAIATAGGLAARILLAIHDAQKVGTWRRLKICRNPECRVAFYDQSRNTSAVWHDTHTCGNISNLRNSRARRRPSTP